MNGAAPMGRWRAPAARCLNPPGGTLPSRPRNALFVLFSGASWPTARVRLDHARPLTFYPRYGITHFANIWATLEGTEAHVLPAVRDYLARKRRERPSVGVILFEGPPYLHKRPNASHKRQFRLLTLEPPDMSSDGTNRSEWFWQRMAPHFDHRSDGVGLVVDGRMAQAFVGDCMPDELAVWSWVGQGDETAVDSWTQTQTGLCVDVRVLPHNALPPVRVETMSVSDWVSGPLGGGRPIIRSDWNVYLVEDRLIYAKDQCSPEDAEPMFFLHLAPVDVNDLPTQGNRI